MPVSTISTARPILTPEQSTPVIELNVRGQHYDIPRAALEAFPCSDLISTGLRGPRRDANGRLYVNWSGASMAPLVDYLRGGQSLESVAEGKLAMLAAASEALNMGPRLDEAVEWEQLRRRVGDLPLETLLGSPRLPAAMARDWLRYQDLTARLGGEGEAVTAPAVAEAWSDEVLAHYTPLLARDPHNFRALLHLSSLEDDLDDGQRIDYAHRAYNLQPGNPWAQWNLVMVVLSANSGHPVNCDRAAGVALLAHLLRELPAEDAAEGEARRAFAARLDQEPLADIEAKLAREDADDEALTLGMLLRRLQRQHEESRPKGDGAPRPRGAGAHEVAVEAFRKEKGLLAFTCAPLTDHAFGVMATRVLKLSDEAAAKAPVDWWQIKLDLAKSTLSHRNRLRSGVDGPLGNADVARLQASYEELWAAYTRCGEARLLAALTQVLSLIPAGEDPEVKAMQAAQAARLRAAAHAHDAGDEAAAWVLDRVAELLPA